MERHAAPAPERAHLGVRASPAAPSVSPSLLHAKLLKHGVNQRWFQLHARLVSNVRPRRERSDPSRQPLVLALALAAAGPAIVAELLLRLGLRPSSGRTHASNLNGYLVRQHPRLHQRRACLCPQ